MFSQFHVDGHKVIYNLSCPLNKCECKFSPNEKEYWKVLFAIEKFSSYIEVTKFTVIVALYNQA